MFMFVYVNTIITFYFILIFYNLIVLQSVT